MKPLSRFIPRRFSHCTVISSFLLGSFALTAADCVEILPVTDRILQVRCVDGFIDPYGPNETIGDNVTYYDPLNLDQAQVLSNYSISSVDDGAYAIARNPVVFGRKSKALDYNAPEAGVPFVLEHWLYLELPSPLAEGFTYTLDLHPLVKNGALHTFKFETAKLRSETVHVNQIGFPEHAPKYAYLSHWMGDFNTPTHSSGGLNLDDRTGTMFHLVDQVTGERVFTGAISKRMAKNQQETTHPHFAPEYNYSHADVWDCDFSAFTTPGLYVVAVDGIGCSFPFEINDECTREPFYYAMKGLFSQRQGIVKEIEPGYVQPRDHHPDDIIWQWDKNWPGGEDASGFDPKAPQVKGIWGHYFDAGDWDGYVHHSKVPMSLMLLYTLAPDRFSDGEIGNRYKLSEQDSEWIDEGTNGIPDLLDEAAWLIEYFRRARNVLLENYGGTGGVPGYVGRDAIDGNNITAWMDTRNWYLSAENVEQTYFYAGLAAWYASCLNQFHRLTEVGEHPESAKWMAEADAAWNWAQNRGASGDAERRARGFAAMLLFRQTGLPVYQSFIEEYLQWEPQKDDGEWSNPNIYDIVIALYGLLDSGFTGLNRDLWNQCRAKVVNKVNRTKLTNSNNNAFRMGIEQGQFFEIGTMNTPKMTLVPVAYRIMGDPQYLDILQNALSYVLGGNQLNTTYLSGLGERSDMTIFNPNGWLFNNPNSMVYTNEPVIGMTSYFGANQYWFTQSVYSEFNARKGAYPSAVAQPDIWPEGESTFRDRYSIQGGEFTIHQQNIYQIYTTGFIKAMSHAGLEPYKVAQRPVVRLLLTEGQDFPLTGCDLQVDASANTKRIDYYWDWHFIGSSESANTGFAYHWVPNLPEGQKVVITAVAYSDRGRKSNASVLGQHGVVMRAQSECILPESVVYLEEPPQLLPLYHFERATDGAHLYTVDSKKKDELVSDAQSKWEFKGITHQLISNPVIGTVPVYYLENQSDDPGIYTSSEVEMTLILRNQPQKYTYAGIACFAYASPAGDAKPVYRFRSKSNHSHFYTIIEPEKQQIIDSGAAHDLQYEGVAWWAVQ